MDLNKIVNVKNRGTGEVGYTLPDSGVRRNWAPGEVKKNITVKELEEATFVPGGLKLIQKYLIINDLDVCEYLGLQTEPEYFYDESEIRTLLNSGSVDQLLDCLDFAPEGVIDLVKKISLETRLNDVAKREAIKKVTGFDITRALENIEFANSNNNEEEGAHKRRTAPVVAEAPVKSGRRAATPQYKRVVEIEEN